ncbi:helix-turn-helix domain-containing protein [Phenylobacterium sp.]|uniref:TetR/AcrR family transcriptional regulator n=1 Tax=Phenylobacterium sp. TaxID=1871053 RepID=UPI003563B0A5
MSAAVARRRGVNRTREVAQAALACFSDGGFRLTQIADVSDRMGVSVGTIYRYVESKEALFHLAALEAVGLLPDALSLPVKVSGPADTAAILRKLVAEDRLWPILQAALDGPAPKDAKAEAGAIAGELYDTIAARAALISLLDRCAHDIPELTDVFDRQMRHRLMDDLETWVSRRDAAAGRQRPDVAALARGAMESVAWLAKSRRRDPTASEIAEDHARAAAVRIFANAFD